MWTKEPPKREGYFWWRYGFEGVEGKARIVRIYETLAGFQMAFIGTEHTEVPGATTGEFWSEPIAGPEEETGAVKS